MTHFLHEAVVRKLGEAISKNWGSKSVAVDFVSSQDVAQKVNG